MPGKRARLRLELRLRLGLGLLDLRDRGLLREDGLLGLAGEKALELLLVDRLALDEDRRRGGAARPCARGARVVADAWRLLDDAADLVVDLLRDLVRVVGLGAHVATEEREVVVPAEHAWPELLGHPEAHDHLLRGRRHALEVVRRARRHLVEDELLRGAPAERHRQLVHERRLRRQVLVLGRQRDREARAPARETRS